MATGKTFLEYLREFFGFCEKEAPIVAGVTALIPGLQGVSAGIATGEALMNVGVPGLCSIMESIFGPGTGDTKYDVVLTATNAIVIALQKAFPNDAAKYAQLATAIPTAIEATIANAKLAQLAAAPAPTPAPAPGQ
jgi:hypothetical protein